MLGLKGVYGSLTLGGYDRSRLIHNDVSFHFAPDQSRDLVVVLHSILSQDSTARTESLLQYPIHIFLDSIVPYIYLPLDACKKFELIFGLIWDPSLYMYTVDDELHKSLTASNPSFTFTLGDSDFGPTVDIVLPYASFDLLAIYPFVPNNTRYFPLLRANNETQYTLGRAFLQEAYVNIHSKFPVTTKTEQHLVISSQIMSTPTSQFFRPNSKTASRKILFLFQPDLLLTLPLHTAKIGLTLVIVLCELALELAHR